ncbi:MAG TPA: nicotinate-nucleotide adenylyltransferase [Patescibacteria group bacterium]|nr:nicotinate-nucleotide adenylyltransferase [Patescibacteria group bacterium]
MPRTAVFGGSFNPIHFGHLLLADDLLEILALDRVLFVPAKHPPHKDPTRLAPPEDRLAMVRLATDGHRGFEVSDLELARPGPSFTVDTLAALARPGLTLFLVVGSETFLDLLSWREPRRVARLARLVIVPRVGSPFDTESEVAQKVLREIGVEGGFTTVDGGRVPERGVIVSRAASMPISASELRRRVREGRSLAFRLPPAVADYIRARGLYRETPA